VDLELETIGLVDFFNDLHQRAEFLPVLDKLELTSKEVEVLEAGVKMGLNAKLAELVQMAVIHVSVHTEETLVDGAKGAHHLLGRGCAGGELLREHVSVVESVLDPRHEQFDVFCGGDCSGLGVLLTVLPEVLVRGTSAHGGAGSGSAEVAHSTVKQVDLIEEVDGVCAEPFTNVLARRELNRKLQITGVEGGLVALAHLQCTRCRSLARLEGLRL